MDNRSEKPDSHEFKIEFKRQLSPKKKEKVINAIKKSPQFSRYYRLQNNDWYQIRNPENQNWHNPPDIEILLKNKFMLVMRPVDNKPWWTQLNDLKDCLIEDIGKVAVSVENYW